MRAQVNVVSLLSITLIVLILTSVGYFWAVPLIEEANELQKKELIESEMIRFYDLAIGVANDKSKAAETVDVVAGKIQLREFYNESIINVFNTSSPSHELGPLSSSGGTVDGDDFAGLLVPRKGAYRFFKMNVSKTDTFDSGATVYLDVGNDGSVEFSELESNIGWQTAAAGSGVDTTNYIVVDITSTINSFLPDCSCSDCTVLGGLCNIGIRGYHDGATDDKGKLNLTKLNTLGTVNLGPAFEWEANLALPVEVLGVERAILGERFVTNDTTGEILREIRKDVIGVIGLDSPLTLVQKGSVIYDLVPRPLVEPGSTSCRGIKFESGEIVSAGKGVHTVILEWDGTNTTYEGAHLNCSTIDYEVVKVTVR